jgi:hypothetical protein
MNTTVPVRGWRRIGIRLAHAILRRCWISPALPPPALREVLILSATLPGDALSPELGFYHPLRGWVCCLTDAPPAEMRGWLPLPGAETRAAVEAWEAQL